MSAIPAVPSAPVTPAETTPQNPLAGNAPASPAPVAETTSDTPAASAAPEIVDPRAEINSLAEQFGYDPSQLAGFSDAQSAREAIRLSAEQTAHQGLDAYVPQTPVAPPASLPYTPPAAPVPTTPAIAQPIDLRALGLEDDEPAAKAIRSLEQRFNSVADKQRAADELAARLDKMEKAAADAAQERLHAQAATVVDGFQSAKYGVGQRRTAEQRMAVQRLYELANVIAVGAHRSGRPIPPLQARLAQARLLDGDQVAPAAPAAPAALPQVSPGLAAPAGKMGLTEKWSENPELMRAIRG